MDEATTGLVRTSQSKAEENVSVIEATVNLGLDGKASRNDVLSWRGSSEDLARQIFGQIARSTENTKQIGEGLKATTNSGKITGLDLGSPWDLDKPYQIRYTAEDWKNAIAQGHTWTVFLAPDLTVLSALKSLKDPKDQEAASEKKAPRTLDYYVPMIGSNEIRYLVIPPAGYAIRKLPEVRQVDLGALKLITRVEARQDHAVLVSYSATITEHRLSVDEGGRVAAGLKDLSKAPMMRLEFSDETEQLLSDGKEKQALELARRRVKDAPGNASAMIGVATTLSPVGANTQAIEVCQKALALDGKSARAWTTLAELYERDEQGRSFHREMQYEPAVKAFRQAITTVL